MNILSYDWPEAIDQSFICRNKEDELYRAQAIVELLIDEQLIGKRFLDFNLHNNYCADYVYNQKNTLYSSGLYLQTENKTNDGLLITSNFNEIENYAPYDVILAFDVFNHLTDDIELWFNKLNKLLAQNGILYLRTHPFSSRHATHFYKEDNKAYIHYCIECGIYHNKINIDEDYLEKVGFSVISKKNVNQPIEKFFHDKFFFDKINETQFVDFKLKKMKKIFI